MAELTEWVDLSAWPRGTRMIVRRELPHPGATFNLFDPQGTATRCSSATRPTPTSPIWKPGTGATPGWRTASAVPRTPD